MKKISQREARRMKRRIAELERTLDDQRKAWMSDWPGGIYIDSCRLPSDTAPQSVRIARMLGHAVVAIDAGDELRFHALPLAKEAAA